MGNQIGSAAGRSFTGRGAKRRQASAGVQILVSLLLLADLFLLYTMIMQLTHQQKAFEASPAVNWALFAAFALGAGLLVFAVFRTGAWKRTLCLLLIFAALYLTAVFSQIPLIREYRNIWISTAMSTMRHQGLATYYFPASIVEERVNLEREAREAQIGDNTPDDTFLGDADEHAWVYNPSDKHGLAALDYDEDYYYYFDDEDETEYEDPNDTEGTDGAGETSSGSSSSSGSSGSSGKKKKKLTQEQKDFYSLFYELDINSTEKYLSNHPSALSNGYKNLLINQSSLSSSGTSIRTKLGEKVLAIDVKNQILLVEVDCAGSRGVLAIAKLPSRLHLYPSSRLPNYGETAGTIARRNGGVLAMTGSAFQDEGGVGNGGQIAGFAICNGTEYQGPAYGWGYKRLELHSNDWFYIKDAPDAVGKNTTDAMEFQPALIINGRKMDVGIWTSKNPRACIGQSERGEILMLCVEGRRVGSLGCSVGVCADVLLKHDCITALNCDGGTTAILWYRGEPVIRCSNSAIPQGRYLPNAWVYVGS